MAGPFYFAWVGGAIDPAFTLETTGNLWSGSLSTAGDTWGGELDISGDTHNASTTLDNLSDITSLRVGKTYSIAGSGLTAGTTFVYAGGFSITLSSIATTSGTGVRLKITNTAERTIITKLDLIDGLISGNTYHIAGDGIPFGTTFVYAGGTSLTINKSATKTAEGVSLTITLASGLNIVSNVGSHAGLVNGQIYNISGIGVPGGATFKYNSGSSDFTMYQDATQSGSNISLTISKGDTEDDGGVFNPAVHNVENEQILGFDISQTEGGFPTLKIDLLNPRVGFLAPARKRWCWLSWFDGSSIVPLFHGRIKGVPQNIEAEVVQIEFEARPNDFSQQKATLARSMRDLPYFDPLWVNQSKINDPDAVLESRTALWDVDRLTLAVAASDTLSGEDGTIELTESEHIYNAVSVSYAETPLRQITMVATATWTQAATGEVDLTNKLVSAFQSAGSPYASPNIGSLTSDGLFSTWPQPGASIGGGWSISLDSLSQPATWIKTTAYKKRFTAKDNSSTKDVLTVTAEISNGSTAVSGITPTTDLVSGKHDVKGVGIPTGATLSIDVGLTTGTLSAAATENNFSASLTVTKTVTKTSSSGLKKGYKNFDIAFDLAPISVYFPVSYVAARSRSETVTFTLTADVQPIVSNAEGADETTITLTSDLVDKFVDLDGTLPIGDPARNLFFPTDRGIKSIEFLLLICAAKLRQRARAVKVKCKTPFGKLVGINCRKNIFLHDYRFPGSQAIGKVMNYSLKFSAKANSMFAECEFGCVIGKEIDLVTATSGTDTYATGYADGYTETTGGKVDIIAGKLQYERLDGTYVIDDDKIDLFNLTPDNIIISLDIAGGPTQQKTAVDAAAKNAINATDVTDAIKSLPTRVELNLVPLDAGSFLTNYKIKPSALTIPKTIDLGAT